MLSRLFWHLVGWNCKGANAPFSPDLVLLCLRTLGVLSGLPTCPDESRRHRGTTGSVPQSGVELCHGTPGAQGWVSERVVEFNTWAHRPVGLEEVATGLKAASRSAVPGVHGCLAAVLWAPQRESEHVRRGLACAGGREPRISSAALELGRRGGEAGPGRVPRGRSPELRGRPALRTHRGVLGKPTSCLAHAQL